MNVAIWVATALLAVAFLGSGAMKLPATREKLQADPRMGWAADFPIGLIKFVGAAEVAGAAGLILPAVFGIATWLVPLAAIGLALVMAGAVVIHARRGEYPNIVVNLVLLALAVFVAVERLGSHAL